MSIKFRKLTKEQERELIIKNLATNLTAIAHDEARLKAALEWTTVDEVSEALALIPDSPHKQKLLALAASR